MMLNYPPPTIINLYQNIKEKADREKARLKSILSYLKNGKLVHDEDLLLIVDGQDTWFQLPSEVMIRQYENVLDDANQRIGDKYGGKFSQTIVFGAQKTCVGEDVACTKMPESMLPDDIYGEATGNSTDVTPARYLDSSMLIGPAKDLKALYEAAVKVFESKSSQSATVQSVMATVFGEQEMARNTQVKKEARPITSKWLDYFGGSAAEPTSRKREESAAVTLQAGRQYEFSIGLDYTHSLFQPLAHTAEDELVAINHDDSTDLLSYHHEGTPTPLLSIPTALQQAKPPFWTPDLSNNNPSPNKRPAHIDKLVFNKGLDNLKPRDTPWTKLDLVQNTYTSAISAAFHVNNRDPAAQTSTSSSANITWTSLWYSGYERALLRKYFRNQQSPIGYHNAATGGDRRWDQRGGRGGVWTEREALWLPWGEVDGVCGTFDQITKVFDDGKSVWLHENDPNAEAERKKEEQELKDMIEEAKKKEAEREKERLEKEAKEKAEKEGKEKEQKEKEEKEKAQKEKEAEKQKAHQEMHHNENQENDNYEEHEMGKDSEQEGDAKQQPKEGDKKGDDKPVENIMTDKPKADGQRNEKPAAKEESGKQRKRWIA